MKALYYNGSSDAPVPNAFGTGYIAELIDFLLENLP
jgi:hypothetical protein